MLRDMFQFGFGGLGLVIGFLGVLGAYKAFQKAGKPGLVALIPILNILNAIDMSGRPLWWILLLLIPGVNVIVLLIIMIGLAQRFGRGGLFGVGLVALAPICWAILGLGSARYQSSGT
jgi:hypothetical protein